MKLMFSIEDILVKKDIFKGFDVHFINVSNFTVPNV